MLLGYHLRTDNDAPINFDLGEHEPIPPEAWRECGGVAHLPKRRVVQNGTRFSTVVECAKCGELLETIEHPSITRAYPDLYKKGVLTSGVAPQVVAYLKEHGPSKTRTIADALDVNHQAVNKALARTPGIERVGEAYDGRNGQNVAVWGWMSE